MEKDDTGWKLVTSDFPSWVLEQETNLNEAILEGLSAK
jgi:hypothetical protein